MPEGRSQPWALYAVIAANVVMFGVELAAGASAGWPSTPQIIELGGSYPPLTLHGEWWRLGSSMFLHFGILHLALNMLCLYQARAVEAWFGRIGFLVIYLVAGLGGGIASLIVNHGNVVVAGASGCVFGVFGAAGAKLMLHRDRFEPEMWTNSVRRFGSLLAVNALAGITVPQISLSAHVGGLLVGAALGVALLAKLASERAHLRRALGLAALGIALTGVGVMALEADAHVVVRQHFYAAERLAGKRQEAAYARYTAGEISEAQLADTLERDVVAPYRQVYEELRATHDVPEQLQPLFDRLEELMAARLAVQRSYQAVLREPDSQKREALYEVYTREGPAIAGRVKAVEAAEAAIQQLEK